MQESNLISSTSSRIPGCSALRSDCTHSRPDILSPDDQRASEGVIVFVRPSLSFSELTTSSLSLLDPFSHYVRVNTLLNNSSSHSFLNVYAPLVRFSLTESRTDYFFPSNLPFSRTLFILRDFNCHHPLLDSKGTSDPRR